MIEITICLGIVALALLVIVGILPLGMTVQKGNRQQTIINEDATIFMEAIRNGAQGVDELTNHVMAITNWALHYWPSGLQTATVYGYTATNSSIGGALPTYQLPLTNGYRIIGLLSTPQIIRLGDEGFLSNHIVAYVRSISGSAAHKAPQPTAAVQELDLFYKLICTVGAYSTNYFDPSWTNTSGLRTNSSEYLAKFNYSSVVSNLDGNIHDVRLTFLWPVLPNGGVGGERLVFRTSVCGELLGTSDHGYPPRGYGGLSKFLYFFQPRTFGNAQ